MAYWEWKNHCEHSHIGKEGLAGIACCCQQFFVNFLLLVVHKLLVLFQGQ